MSQLLKHWIYCGLALSHWNNIQTTTKVRAWISKLSQETTSKQANINVEPNRKQVVSYIWLFKSSLIIRLDICYIFRNENVIILAKYLYFISSYKWDLVKESVELPVVCFFLEKWENVSTCNRTSESKYLHLDMCWTNLLQQSDRILDTTRFIISFVLGHDIGRCYDILKVPVLQWLMLETNVVKHGPPISVFSLKTHIMSMQKETKQN